MKSLTSEQLAVVNHPTGQHAKVLAVAGSGKTSTMVCRIKYLVEECQVDPKKILVLMFNTLARKQFIEKLSENGMTNEQCPPVHTFHSFANTLIEKLISHGVLTHSIERWINDKEELKRVHIKKAIQNLSSKGVINSQTVDQEECETAISLWKSMLIPPHRDRAGHRSNKSIPLVYFEFERLRTEKRALTFDDFVPLGVGALASNKTLQDEFTNRYGFIIVDEYQDVNFGQQRMIEILAGQRADVMVVGDDDQTIYEWRGARPDFIIKQFEVVFHNKPTHSYTLSQSFRFGPLIAQCAENVISFNNTRNPKNLIAHNVSQQGTVAIISNSSEQANDVNQEMVQKVVELVKETQDPTEVVVLCRMFSQLAGMEAEFLTRKIPYRILGRRPFFERNEIQSLLSYLQLGIDWQHPIDKAGSGRLLKIINMPNRKLNKGLAGKTLEKAIAKGLTFEELFKQWVSRIKSPFSITQHTTIQDLQLALQRMHELVNIEPEVSTYDILRMLVDIVDYKKHFQNYYGEGEDSQDRLAVIDQFLIFLKSVDKTPADTIDYVNSLDSTQGQPENYQILMTTIYRTKGLDFDYVFVPDCYQDKFPANMKFVNPVFDLADMLTSESPSAPIENERRLFYVAVTRARKGVFLGTSKPPTKGKQSQSTPTLPSQFLNELQLDGTVTLMNEYCELSNNKKAAGEKLKKAVQEFGGIKKVISNLTAHYLPSIGQQELANQVVKIADEIPPEKIEYPAYSPVLASVTQVAEVAAKGWWESQ